MRVIGSILIFVLVSSCDLSIRPGSFHYTPKIELDIKNCSYESLRDRNYVIDDSTFFQNAILPEINRIESHWRGIRYPIVVSSEELIVIQPIHYKDNDTCYIYERITMDQDGFAHNWAGHTPSRSEMTEIKRKLDSLINICIN